MPFVDNRKVHSVGDGGKAIVLHAGWCRYWDIKTGDTIKVIGDKILAIIPPNMPDEKKKEVLKKLEGLML